MITAIMHTAGPEAQFPEGIVQTCRLCGQVLMDARGQQTPGGGPALVWEAWKPVYEFIDGVFTANLPEGQEAVDCRFVRRT